MFAALLPAYISITASLVKESRYWLLGIVGFALWAFRILGLRAVIDKPKKYWWKGLLLVLAGVVAGLAVSHLLPHKTPRPPTLSITTPASTLDCPTKGPQCQFVVTGRSFGVATDLEIFVLVSPVHPAGSGWYVQSPPASIGGNGDWTQSPSYLGAPGYPVHAGDTLQIEAVLVPVGATYKGTALSSLGSAISDPRQITGIITQSNIIFLKVLK